MWSIWGARLSDTIDVPMHTPRKDLRSLGSHHTLQTCRILPLKLLGSNNICWYLPCTNPTLLCTRVAGGDNWQTPLQNKKPQVSAGHTKSSPSPHPPSLMRFPLFHGRAEQAWLVGLAWRQAEVHEQKAKFPTAEMFQDTTATISIIILNWC